ncbi:hypothetical protein SAMN05428954_1234 [Streptomyces sp. 2112.3]|nr:hypothetical protein SAMN05428954_1234 [Streptomyces sp. 2112.3]
MGLQQFLDPRGDEFSLVEHCLEQAGEAGDDQCGRVRAGNDHGLLVQRGEDVLDQPFGHARCLRADQVHQPSVSGLVDLGRGTELVERLEHRWVLHSRPQHAFQRRMDLRQQAPQPVADAGGFTGQAVVEAHDHLQLGDRLVGKLDGPHCVRHRAGGVRDDERVAGVGLGLTPLTDRPGVPSGRR